MDIVTDTAHVQFGLRKSDIQTLLLGGVAC